MDIKIDGEFQSLIPPLTDDEFSRLEKSILAEGVREPIITWNGTIIDGHNRYRICQKHGLSFKTTEREFESRDAAKIWIIENQFGRRNLGNYERSVLALQLESLYAAEAKKRQLSTLKQNATDVQNSAQRIESGKTRDKLAKIAGVSHDTIRKVKVIESEAEKGNEVAIAERDALKSGEKKSINGAYNRITGHNKPRICNICGKPIHPGEADDGKPYAHKACDHKRRAAQERGKRDATKDLCENVAVYTADSLLTQLSASAKSLQEAWQSTIKINEEMGVELSSEHKELLEKAAANLMDAINKIKEEK